jgi:hypothetical protein
MPSLASSSSSIKTSLPLALRSLGSYLIGHASVMTKRAASPPASSWTTITTFLPLVLDLSRRDVRVPFVEVERRASNGQAPLQRDISVLREPTQFSYVGRIGALAVIDRVDRRFSDHHFAESGLGDAVDLQPVAEIA